MLLQQSSPSCGLAWAQGEHRSPLFHQENRITVLHSPSSVILLAVLEWAGTGLCAKVLLFPPWRWEKGTQKDPLQSLDTFQGRPRCSPALVMG